jgi:hypothetical protein
MIEKTFAEVLLFNNEITSMKQIVKQLERLEDTKPVAVELMKIIEERDIRFHKDLAGRLKESFE